MHTPIDSAVIAVAGLGTRLYPTSASVPKEMLPVGRFPVLHHVLEELTAAGISRILLITNRNKTAIRHYIIDELPRQQERWRDVEFDFVEQAIPEGAGKPAGTGDAVALAEEFVADRDFVVAFGDSIIDSEHPGSLVARMVREHEAHRAACCIAVTEVPLDEVSRYGVVDPEPGTAVEGVDSISITGIVEKPVAKQAPSRLAVSARYCFSPAIFARLRATEATGDGEIYLTHAIDALMQADMGVRAVPLMPQERRCDIGNHTSYFEAFVDFALADPDCGERLAAYMRRALDGRTA